MLRDEGVRAKQVAALYVDRRLRGNRLSRQHEQVGGEIAVEIGPCRIGGGGHRRHAGEGGLNDRRCGQRGRAQEQICAVVAGHAQDDVVEAVGVDIARRGQEARGDWAIARELPAEGPRTALPSQHQARGIATAVDEVAHTIAADIP